jgi:hypothetical protein
MDNTPGIKRGSGPERRSKRRFTIDQHVRYRPLYGDRLGETAVGRAVDMSSSGLWIVTTTMLPIGIPVEVLMTWPVLLNDVCPMKLMIYGCVVRSNEQGAAINIERYEFRTMATTALPVAAARKSPQAGYATTPSAGV